MLMTIVAKDDLEILNQCTKYLNRAGDPAASPEAWRFPIIDVSHVEPFDELDPNNEVTFVYKVAAGSTAQVAVVGTFGRLYEPIPLKPVQYFGEDTGYRAVTGVIPKGQVHIYKYFVDGALKLDPINPQQVRLENGNLWSRFFTDSYLEPLILERWELNLLYRLTEQILPFRTEDAELYLQQFYNNLARGAKDASKVYRLDESVGEVNAIDKLLARDERHRLIDYRLCLKQIDGVLRKRNPNTDPDKMSKESYIDLYTEMTLDPSVPANRIDGWDYGAYSDPRYFLYILRRHAVTGAFSHPKYCGNVGAAGWAYLSERYPFDWRPALEPPLGTSPDYR